MSENNLSFAGYYRETKQPLLCETDCNTDYLVIQLENYASPSFITTSKPYLTTKEELLKFIKELKEKTKNSYCDFANKLQKGADEHNDIVTGFTPLARKKYTLSDVRYTHINIWGYPYYITADSASVDYVWGKYKSGNKTKYCGFYKAVFSNLKYSAKEDSGFLPVGSSWGFPCVIFFDKDKTSTRLFEYGARFVSLEDMLQTAKDFHPEDIEFHEFFNEIFADG